MDRVLPEWERIRLLPHASVIHRFTVDRHLVETCIEASALIRHVGRPDVLMVAALLHDIGKGELTEHSVAGEPIARTIATRMGFDERSVDLVGTLVRWHLLLAETASARDPDDPATVRRVTERVPDLEALNLLRALTESDARATAPKAWSTWRANLIDTVGRQAAQALGGAQVEALAKPTWAEVAVPKAVRKGATCIDVELLDDGAQVTVLAPDRLGLLADVAALFATQRASVRAARAWNQGDVAVSVWDVADAHLDAAVLRQRFEAIAAGRLDPAARLRRTLGEGLAPTVVVRPEASSPVDRARGTGRRPHRRALPGVCGPGRPGPLRPFRPRRHPRPPGRRRLLRAGGGRRRPRRPPRLPGRPRRPRGPHPLRPVELRPVIVRVAPPVRASCVW